MSEEITSSESVLLAEVLKKLEQSIEEHGRLLPEIASHRTQLTETHAALGNIRRQFERILADIVGYKSDLRQMVSLKRVTFRSTRKMEDAIFAFEQLLSDGLWKLFEFRDAGS